MDVWTAVVIVAAVLVAVLVALRLGVFGATAKNAAGEVSVWARRGRGRAVQSSVRSGRDAINTTTAGDAVQRDVAAGRDAINRAGDPDPKA